ncbi:hypothetical protein C8J57DRAFT_1503542 [Mycena rebaudengoi]|nr:hypothetical protein C8J57DRAFT_1503542 [Mycena rebaudengoi]
MSIAGGWINERRRAETVEGDVSRQSKFMAVSLIQDKISRRKPGGRPWLKATESARFRPSIAGAGCAPRHPAAVCPIPYAICSAYRRSSLLRTRFTLPSSSLSNPTRSCRSVATLPLPLSWVIGHRCSRHRVRHHIYSIIVLIVPPARALQQRTVVSAPGYTPTPKSQSALRIVTWQHMRDANVLLVAPAQRSLGCVLRYSGRRPSGTGDPPYARAAAMPARVFLGLGDAAPLATVVLGPWAACTLRKTTSTCCRAI